MGEQLDNPGSLNDFLAASGQVETPDMVRAYGEALDNFRQTVAEDKATSEGRLHWPWQSEPDESPADQVAMRAAAKHPARSWLGLEIERPG